MSSSSNSPLVHLLQDMLVQAAHARVFEEINFLYSQVYE